MNSGDVLGVLDLLSEGGIVVWLDGGWGVDALLGEQTRPHDDLDIVLKHEDLSHFTDTMTKHGFAPFRDDGPFNFVLADSGGHQVDVHLVDLDTTRTDDNGAEVYGPNGLEYEVGCLAGSGMVSGRPVLCCTAEFQVASHAAGYEPDEDDFRDVSALHRRFGIPLPPPYDQW